MWSLMESVQQVPCMVMESVHGVMRRVAGLARAHARATRATRRLPHAEQVRQRLAHEAARAPAGKRQCGSLIEPVEDAGEARLPRADDGRGGETCAGDASPALRRSRAHRGQHDSVG